MKLKDFVLDNIRQNTKLKRELMYRLGISETTFYRLLRENRPDGDLTRMKALQILSDELGMPIAELIIESEHATVK